MGRIGKPLREKVRAGNAGHRPLVDTPAAPSRPMPAGLQPPAWMTSREAKVIWNDIARELNNLRFLSAIDAHTFGRYCHHFSEWLRLNRIVEKEGETIDTPMTGHTDEAPKFMKRLHPLTKRIEQHETRMLELEDRFGVSAMARYRLVAQSAARPGAFASLFGELNQGEPANDAKPEGAPAPAPTTAASDGARSPFGFVRSGPRPN
jgi:P27 family predicted phage terminase small subunit